MRIETIESNAFKPTEIELKEKMIFMNKSFTSKLTPENGIYGITETVKDNGVVERLGINEFGHKYKEFFLDGLIKKRFEIFGNGCNAVTSFDDNETAYLRKVTQLNGNRAKVISNNLTPNITITKGNFTAMTDAYGRPVLNRMTDLQIRPEGTARKSLDRIVRDNSYRKNDQKGHLIADCFGGPSSRENVVPQLDKVNQGKMAKVENVVRDLKKQGYSVDYEIKTNYVGSKSNRPSSFEPRIVINGEEYKELPAELKKIYNNSSESSIKKGLINQGEKFGIANEMGIKTGLVAAGITFSISTVDNVSSFLDGNISSEDMAINILEDTAAAGGLGYATTFISTAASQALSKSSISLISKVGGSCAPAAAVSFAVESYGDISEFAQGKIDGNELAYDLGENATEIAGSFAGGAAAGAALGTVAGPAGMAAGTVIGGVVGCALASEAYATAVEAGAPEAKMLADKAEQFARVTVDAVAETAPEQLDNVKTAINDFADSADLPFKISTDSDVTFTKSL